MTDALVQGRIERERRFQRVSLEMQKLSQRSPFVAAVIGAYLAGVYSYEQALEAGMLTLAGHAEQLIRENLKLRQLQPMILQIGEPAP